MTTVAICDIEPVAIEGLRALIESAALRVVAAVASLPAAMEAVRAQKPSLLIVDKSFGIQAVTEWIGALRKSQSGTASIVWSAAVSEGDAIQLIQAGARGVVRKTAPLSDLLSCIGSVAAGGTWMEDGMLRETVQLVHAAHPPLTYREMQIMELVERDIRSKEIGTRLGIRTGTVQAHLKHIFQKTGIRGRYPSALSRLKEKGLPVVVAA